MHVFVPSRGQCDRSGRGQHAAMRRRGGKQVQPHNRLVVNGGVKAQESSAQYPLQIIEASL